MLKFNNKDTRTAPMAFSIFVEKNNYLKWVSIFLITLKRMLRLLVKNLALNLILRI